jgi:enamine deaminase RidA (YjgF/YER057c/UK114 family)
LPDYMAVRNALFPVESPASTLMIVSGFAREIFKIEIEVVAAAPVKRDQI